MHTAVGASKEDFLLYGSEDHHLLITFSTVDGCEMHRTPLNQ